MSRPDPRPRSNRLLPFAKWPAADITAWNQAVGRHDGPFRKYGGGRRRSPFTYEKYAAGYSAWLWFLRSTRQLDPAEPPGQRVTLERLDRYLEHLEACGNAYYTKIGRFEELRGALQLMEPDGDFEFVTRPLGVSIRQTLTPRRRQLFVPDARHNVLWAEDLLQKALATPVAAQRCILLRDAAIIGVLAVAAPRLRALHACRLGYHVKRTAEEWVLIQEAAITKERTVSEVPLGPRISRILDRYTTVERLALLNGKPR